MRKKPVSTSQLVSLIAISGIFVFSILGYISFQQHVERTLTITANNAGKIQYEDFALFKELPQVTDINKAEFIARHVDGVPVDYLVPVQGWPAMKAGYNVYLVRLGCVVNNKPKETCSEQSYVAINWSEKHAVSLDTLEAVSKIAMPISTQEEALAFVQFLTSTRYSPYFGINFMSLTPMQSDEDKQFDDTGFHLTQKAWLRLELHPPRVRHAKGKFYIDRVGFIPFGEKQIIEVHETLTSDGEYIYDIDSILYQGTLVPIDVKSFVATH